MFLTPTYHVFEMFKEHQGAHLVESAIAAPSLHARTSSPARRRAAVRPASYQTPYVTESASVAEDGSITVTIANLSADTAAPIEMRLDAVSAKLSEARILTGDIHDKNEFDTPDAVRPKDFSTACASRRLPPARKLRIRSRPAPSQYCALRRN